MVTVRFGAFVAWGARTMSEQAKPKRLSQSDGGFEDWLMPDYTRGMVLVGLSLLAGFGSLLIFNNPLASCLVTLVGASTAVVAPALGHAYKKIERHLASHDEEIGQWAEEQEASIQEFQLQQREHVANVETRLLGLVTKVIDIGRLSDRDPAIKVDVEGLARAIEAYRTTTPTKKPGLKSRDRGKKGVDDAGPGVS